jgi:hypothetical protein
MKKLLLILLMTSPSLFAGALVVNYEENNDSPFGADWGMGIT